MMSGGSCQNRGQSIDSSDDPLFNLIAAMHTIFLAPFTHTPRRAGGLIKFGPPLAAIRAWAAGPVKWWRTGHYFWMILSESRSIHRLARRPLFNLIAPMNTIGIPYFWRHLHTRPQRERERVRERERERGGIDQIRTILSRD